MKILICNFESLGTPSGVASYAVKLVRHIPCLDALTTRNVFNTPLEEREINLDAKTRYNEIIWLTCSSFKAMNRKIREADLIHLNPFNFTELILLLIAKMHGKKCIAVMHSNINAHFLTPTLALEMARLTIVYQVMLLLADRVVFLSQAQYRNYEKYSLLIKGFRKKAAIIPNAIESERILKEKKPKAARPLTCIFVGRFERRKGIFDLLALAGELKQEEIQFLVVGFSPLQLPTAPSNMTIVGKVNNEDLFEYYDKSDIFLIPSYSESFGITILEAMARGLVVLAWDIPGMGEKIEPERNGFLFPPGDIEKMKEKILFLRDNPPEIDRIGKNNLADVHHFTADKQARKYLDMYRRMLGDDENAL